MYDYIFRENFEKTNRKVNFGKKIFKWFTATKLRKALSSILAVLIFFTAIRFIFLQPKEVSAADTFLKLDEGYGTTTSDANSTVSALTISGATWRTDDVCFDGKCLYFDGNDQVSVTDANTGGNLDFTQTESFTVIAWFRHNTSFSGTAQDIVAKIDPDDNDGGWRMQLEADGTLSFKMDDDDADTTMEDTLSSTATYGDNKWHMAAFVKSTNSSMTLYVDGSQVATGTPTVATTLANDDNFTLGLRDDATSPDTYFTGFIDEVKVYRSARTSAQIQSDYNGLTPSRGTSASFGPDQSFLSNGLVGYWKLDETASPATDYSGNGNSGTWTNTPTSAAGKYGKAISLSGTAQHIDAGSGSSLDNLSSGPMTVSAWYYHNSNTGRILDKQNSGTTIGWQIETNDSGRDVHFVVAYTGTDLSIQADSNMAASTWHHVVVTWDGSNTYTNAHIYINGVEQTTLNGVLSDGVGTPENDSTTSLGIGCRADGDSQCLNGRIDETRVYNRMLSPSEVAKLYNWAPGPQAYWNLDENTGTTTAYDKSTNNKDLTLVAVGGGTSTVVSDTFTVGSDTELTSHIPDTGTGWTGVQNNLTCTQPSAANTNLVILSTTDSTKICVGSTFNDAGQWATAQPNPSSAEQTISVTIAEIEVSTAERTAGIFGRRTDNDNAYVAYLRTNGFAGPTVQLYRISGGSANSLGTWDADGGAGDGQDLAATDIITLEITDATKRVLRNDVEIISSSDNTLTSAGTWGLGKGRWQGSSSTILAGNANFNWRLDNFVAEETIAGAPPSWVPGQYGSALSFAGSNQQATRAETGTGDIDFGSSESFTFGAWFKHGTASATQTILSNLESSGTDGGYKIKMESDGDITCETDDDDADTTIDDTVSTTAATYDDNNWHHVSCVYDTLNTDFYIYIDGILVATDSTTTANSLSNDDTTFLGIESASGTEDWVGSLDDIKIYNYARTVAQIIEDMNGGHPAPGSPVGSAMGYWKFDEGTDNTCPGGSNDTCNSGNTGTDLDGTNNASTWTNSGKFGKALTFNGSSSYVNITDSAALDITGDFTLSAWVSRAGGTNGYIITKFGSSGSGGYALLHGNTGEVYCRTDNGSSLTDSYTSAGFLPADSTWHNLVAVRSGSSCKVYVDGNDRTNTIGVHATVTANALPLRFGASSAVTPTDYFNGNLDDVRVFNTALTSDQIKVLHNHGANAVMGASSTDSSGNATFSDANGYCPPGHGSTCTPPVGEWKFDENTGTTAFDSSGKGNNATLTSGPSYTSGKIGQAINFDGVDDLVRDSTVTTDVQIPGDTTVSLWFYARTWGAGEIISTMRGSGEIESDNEMYLLELNTTSGNDIRYQHENGAGLNNTITFDTNLSTNTWYHVIVARDVTANTVDMYINGELISSSSYTNDPTGGSTSDFRVGGNATTDYLDGLVDNVQIFNYKFNMEQVAWNFNRGKPVAHWRLDETLWNGTSNEVKDSSGFAVHGNRVGNATTTTSGKFNNAGTFDGTGDYVNFGKTSFQSTAQTGAVTAWVKKTSSNFGYILNSGDSDTDSHIGFAVDTTTNKPYIWQVSGGGSSEDIRSNTSISLNTWTHLAYVSNGADYIFYINGKRTGYATDGGSGDWFADTVNMDNLRIGFLVRDDGFGGYWNGEIDDLRVYNYALTDEQVNLIMNEGAAVRFAPLTGSPQ